MVWTRFLGPLRNGPLRILGPLTKKNNSRSTQKYQHQKLSDNYEDKPLKNRESNPIAKYFVTKKKQSLTTQE